MDRIPERQTDVSSFFPFLPMQSVGRCSCENDSIPPRLFHSSQIFMYFSYFPTCSNEKQNDFVDQIESVAYVLCGDEPVNLTSFKQIFHAKGVSANTYAFRCPCFLYFPAFFLHFLPIRLRKKCMVQRSSISRI